MCRRSLTSLASAIALAAAAALLAACGPGSEGNLTDPREILSRTLTATSQLQTVTFRAELQVRDPNNPNAGVGGVDGGVLEGQVDFVTMELTARAISATGAELGRLILIDETLFSTSGGNARWQQLPMGGELLADPAAALLFGGGLPGGGGPDYLEIVGRAIQGPELRLATNGAEDCAAGRCYRTTIEIPQDALWPLVVSLAGLDRVPGFQPAPPPAADLPQVSLSVLTDTATLRLIELAGGGSSQGTSFQVRIQLAEHDAPVSIQAPPPNLVDPGFGGGFAPAPMPVPAEPMPMPVPVEPAPMP